MHRSRVIMVIGALVALLPMLGFPRAWESFFQVAAGLGIIGLSVWSSIDKKISLRAKAQMRQARKIIVPSVLPAEEDSESAPVAGRRITDFYPKTGQPGRRVSDLNPGGDEEVVN